MEPLELDPNSEWPNLAGRVCDRLMVEEYVHRGQVVTPANVTWIMLESAWHRIYFDCGIFYWRLSDEGPMAYEMPELESEVRLVDLGLVHGWNGVVFNGIEGHSNEAGSEVTLRFADGRWLALRNVYDSTDYVVG